MDEAHLQHAQIAHVHIQDEFSAQPTPADAAGTVADNSFAFSGISPIDHINSASVQEFWELLYCDRDFAPCVNRPYLAHFSTVSYEISTVRGASVSSKLWYPI